jgi:hypothetical protein
MDGTPKTSFRSPYSSPMPPKYLNVFASSVQQPHADEESSEDIFSQFTEINSPALLGSTDQPIAGSIWADPALWSRPEDPYAWMVRYERVVKMSEALTSEQVNTYPVPQALPEPENGGCSGAVSRSSSTSTESSEAEGDLTPQKSSAVPETATIGRRDRVAERRERRRTQNRRA